MATGRHAVLTGQQISLKVVFTDDAGNLVDPDSTPVLYIYDEDVDTDTINDEADAKVYTSALTGPLTSTKLSTGYYKYDYTVPSASDAGTWHDLWVSLIDTADTYDVFSFTVTVGADLSIQTVSTNTMMIVELADTIANDDGDETLEATQLYYSTTYDPFYASPDMVRMEVGAWINYIPDDTLALMIYWSSKIADFIKGPETQSWGNWSLTRSLFVMYDAALRAVSQPGAGQEAGSTSGKKKALGELSINDGTTNLKVDAETLKWLQEQRNEWWRVVNAGGNIVPGQGFDPTFAVKGYYDPDRRNTGRLWDSPSDYNYPIPSVNTKHRVSTRRRGRFRFTNRTAR